MSGYHAPGRDFLFPVRGTDWSQRAELNSESGTANLLIRNPFIPIFLTSSRVPRHLKVDHLSLDKAILKDAASGNL